MRSLKNTMILAKTKWEKQGFSADGFIIAGAICGSKEMHESFGSTEDAFLELIKYCESNKTEEQVLSEISKLAKII